MNLHKNIAGCIGSALIMLALVPAILHSPNADASGATLSDIKEAGYVRVGFSNLTPWAYVGPDSELTGVEPTLIKAFLGSIGDVEMDGVLTQYVSLIPGLQAGRFDIIGAGMQIRPSRCKEIAFGEPEWLVTQGFIVRVGNPKNLTRIEDIVADPEITLGVVAGGAEREYAIVNGVPEDQISIFPDLPTAASGLRVGRVDVLMFTSVSARGLIERQTDDAIEYVDMDEPPLDKNGEPVIGYGAIGFRHADDDLRHAWNRWLDEVRASGELAELLAPYGFTDSDIPDGTITAEDLCRG